MGPPSSWGPRLLPSLKPQEMHYVTPEYRTYADFKTRYVDFQAVWCLSTIIQGLETAAHHVLFAILLYVYCGIALNTSALRPVGK